MLNIFESNLVNMLFYGYNFEGVFHVLCVDRVF